jgi:hypothetical protein
MRARTLTALRRLDSSRKTEAMQFLVEANLVHSPVPRERKPVISLNGADLRNTNLFGANT